MAPANNPEPSAIESKTRFWVVRQPLFWFVAVLSCVMVWSSQIGGDQLNIIARGYLLSHDHILLPFGTQMSGGGQAPGVITNLLIGGALWLYPHALTPSVLVALFHLFAYLILDRLCARMTSPHERFLFLIFYWLNPWRVFFSAFLWNPNFVVLASAIQLWTLYKQRSRASFGASCALVVGIGFLFQLHAQVVILAVATLLCWVTGISKYSIRGVLAGVLVVGLTLAPWALHVLNNPAHLPIRNEKNFIGRSLVNPIHLATGIEMIARYGSFDVMNKISRIDLTPRLGATVDKAATPYLGALMEGVAYPSYVVSWVALLAVLARVGRSAFAKGEGLSDREWLERVIVLHLSAGVLMVALSPTTIMGWQLQVLLPSIAFTLVLFFSRLAERLVIFSRVYLALWIAACLVLLPAIGIGVPYYRPGGRFSVGIPLRNDHPILHELKLLEHSSMCIRKDGVGWWSDVLPDLNPPTSEEGEWRGGKPADPAASCPGP